MGSPVNSPAPGSRISGTRKAPAAELSKTYLFTWVCRELDHSCPMFPPTCLMSFATQRRMRQVLRTCSKRLKFHPWTRGQVTLRIQCTDQASGQVSILRTPPWNPDGITGTDFLDRVRLPQTLFHHIGIRGGSVVCRAITRPRRRTVLGGSEPARREACFHFPSHLEGHTPLPREPP